MCAEYYPAWFDTWGQAHHPPKSDRQFFGPIDWMFEHRASFSLYMAHGGTSFGGWSGCRNPFIPNVTSYDYEAPINEHGKANPSFAKYRELAAKHLNPGETIPDVPASMPVKPTSVDMQISGVDSEEEVRDDGVAENAIDGQVEAYWLSSSRTLPHWIEFRVSDKTQIHGFRYTPRQGNGIGRIKDWKLHVR